MIHNTHHNNTNIHLINNIIKETQHQTHLQNIANNIKHLTHIDIYTDGSLIDLGKPTCKIGIGWFIANTNTNREKF